MITTGQPRNYRDVYVKKRRPFLKWVIVALSLFVILYAVFLLWPIDREEKAFFQTENRPIVIAHQGGNLISPSNTIVAFDKAVQLGVDVLEYDIHITSDDHLVVIHDNTVDRTTNGEGRVAQFTLEQIQQLDAAYTFEDLNGELSYQGQGHYIPTLEEMFQRYPDMLHNIELKKTNPEEKHSTMVQLAWNLIQSYNMEDKVLIASFEHKINREILELSGQQIAISGGRSEITKFVLLSKAYLHPFYRPNIDAIQIPTSQSGFNLKTNSLIKHAHRAGLHVHYWTINDEQTMRVLINMGVDGIITDRPDLLIQILEEKGLR